MNFDHFSDALEQHKIVCSSYKQDKLSESDTRSKLLDSLLINVLGYHEQNISREAFVKVGYYDYLVKVDGFAFVVEAKKTSLNFVLPLGSKSCKLKTIYKENKEVIDQIRSYLDETGYQWGVIANGSQLVVGKFLNSDGTSWRENTATIYHDIADLQSRVVELYNQLEVEAVKRNLSLESQVRVELFRKTLRSTIDEPMQELIRNSFAGALMPIIETVFTEIFDNEYEEDSEFIRECFVRSKESKKNQREIDRAFLDTPPKLDNVYQVDAGHIVGKEIHNRLLSDEPRRNQPPPQPIIIVGSRGAGKTTFINYVFKREYAETLMSSRIPIFVDLRRYASLNLTDDANVLYQDLLSSLYKNSTIGFNTKKVLLRIYRTEILQYESGMWSAFPRDSVDYEVRLSTFLEKALGQPKNHLKKLSEYLIAERRIRLVIVIDNSDQLPDLAQREAFLFAQSLNLGASCAVVLSLREGYYYKWRYKPPFDAYQSTVYHVTAPDYGEVLQKRINFATSKLEKNQTVKGRSLAIAGAQLEISGSVIIQFFETLSHNLFDYPDSPILEFMHHTTHPNTREALELFKQFLRSGHTNVADYVITSSKGKKIRRDIPLYEFVKSVALLNKVYYNSAQSLVFNLLRPAEGCESHLAKFHILKWLINNRSESRPQIPVRELVQTFVSAGYIQDTVHRELESLLQADMVTDQFKSVDTANAAEEVTGDTLISISMKGKYYIDKLLNTFGYIDLIAFDTPVYMRSHFDAMARAYRSPNLAGKRSLRSRAYVVLNFLLYLEDYERKFGLQGLPSLVVHLNSGTIRETLDRLNQKISK